MSMRQGVIDGALQKMRAAAHLGMGDDWFRQNHIGDKTYAEIVELLRESDRGVQVLHSFAHAFMRGMNQAAEESDFQKIRQPDGATIDRATLVRQSKEDMENVQGWGQHFLKIDPEDPKSFAGFEITHRGTNQPIVDILDAYYASEQWAFGAGAGMLLIGGIPGTGKTHLAKAAFAYLASHQREVFYRREIDLISNLQRSIQDHNVEAVMEEIQTCPWLIIDDYGAAPAGNWGRGQLDAIIDSRWESAATLRTMLTTNLDAEGMKKQSPRIWSRLSDRTRAKRVAMGPDAEDYREKRGS